LTSIIADYGEINPLIYLVGAYNLMIDNFKEIAGIEEEQAVEYFIRTFEEEDYPTPQTEIVFINLIRNYKIDVNPLYYFLKRKQLK